MTSNEADIEVSAVQQANNNCRAFFEELNKELNKNTIELKLKPGNFYHVPTIKTLGNCQKIPTDVGAFALEAPNRGTIEDVHKKQHEKEAFVIRRVVSYNDISQINNGEDPKNLLLPVVTEMIMALKRDRGFGPETLNAGSVYGTFKRPGEDNSYFRELENYAGMEIRLYSDTWNCIALEE